MDPIEKLLSELAPVGAPGELDRAMAQLFNHADRRRAVRRVVRGAFLAIAMLAVGGLVGYRFGASTVPPAPASTITYVLPLEPNAYRSLVDDTTTVHTESPLKSGSIVVTMLGEGSV